MRERQVYTAMDTILEPFVGADAARADDLLAKLMREEAEPLIRRIVGSKLRSYAGNWDAQEAEDVCGEVRLQLIARLATLRQESPSQAIQNFRSYVAVTAYRACYEYLRRKYPRRYSLKQRLRQVLNEPGDFALWETHEGEWVAGLTAWRQRSGRLRLAGREAEPEPRWQDLRADPQAFVQSSLPRGTVYGVPLEALLKAILEWAEQPVELDDLVGFVAELQGIHESSTEPEGQDQADHFSRLADQRASVLVELEQRNSLGRLWGEVRQMSPRHIAALLLNLRDGEGGSALDLLLYTGTATFGHLAAALQMSEVQLAQIWNQLPFDDVTIAAHLGLTRQQVINLRRSARERLARRMSS